MPLPKKPIDTEAIHEENTELALNALDMQREQIEVFKDIAGILEEISETLKQIANLYDEDD